jgi:hypothetical protein
MHWADRLASGLTILDGVTGTDPDARPVARAALAEAAERNAAARDQLARAVSRGEIALARRTAIEGLHALRTARVALGLDPGAPVPSLDDVTVLRPDGAGAADVRPAGAVVDGTEYRYSPNAGSSTPYYYAGGTVGGRVVPAGWYSSRWWKKALIAGAGGLGAVVVTGALFGALTHHGGGHGLLGTGHGPGPGGGWMGGPGGFDGFDGFDAF